jgi:hypothetical protein
MRYFLQIEVMLGDLILIVASARVLYEAPKNPLIWIFIILIFKTWQKQGGFEAWNPKIIKQFFANAKKLGL